MQGEQLGVPGTTLKGGVIQGEQLGVPGASQRSLEPLAHGGPPPLLEPPPKHRGSPDLPAQPCLSLSPRSGARGGRRDGGRDRSP